MNRIKQVRKAKGYSQQSLAKELNVNQTAVSQWERGITTPSNALLKKLSQLLEVSTDYLLGLSNDKNVYSWDDQEIMEAIKDNLPDQLSNLASAIAQQSQKNQKLIFDILVEIKSILNTEDLDEKDFYIDLLHESIFALSIVKNRAKKYPTKK